jgi:hypothetical protein
VMGTVEVALRRTGMRGRAAVDRLEKFPAEFSVKNGAFCLAWTAANGQRIDLSCPLTSEVRETLVEALESRNVEGAYANTAAPTEGAK